MSMHEDIKQGGRETREIESLYDMSLAELADWIDNSVDEFMSLNPRLIRFATIPKGTVFNYYVD